MNRRGTGRFCQPRRASYDALAAARGARQVRPRMGVEVDVAEAIGGQMGVDLGRADVGVAEHLLQRPQIAAARQQVGGERVAQRVRAHPVIQAGGARVALDDLVQPLTREARGRAG